MKPEETREIRDQDELYRRFFDGMQREYLKTLVCERIIEEHRRNPLGQHSEALERLLHYFRNAPQAGKYAIRRGGRSAPAFRIVALSGVRGEPPRNVEDRGYATVEEVHHAIFLKRIRHLMES